MTKLIHDKLQHQCHMWLWNEYPQHRGLFHANFNDIKIVEKLLGRLMRVSIPDKVRRIVMSTLKSIGLVKGVLDYQLYYKGMLHIFDFKVGSDRLSEEQRETIDKVEGQGGKGYEIRSLKEFKEVINGILGSSV